MLPRTIGLRRSSNFIHSIQNVDTKY
uniref:Uncharacterized protein n=1 Tax=Anguilla anguilla TaxID=7936 RepID=A0A0E9SIG3_ANGAN